MPDFGDNEWPGMLCIETANVAAQAIELSPGQHHTTIATSNRARFNNFMSLIFCQTENWGQKILAAGYVLADIFFEQR